MDNVGTQCRFPVPLHVSHTPTNSAALATSELRVAPALTADAHLTPMIASTLILPS